MERQPIKILFLYYGQPRMVKETLPWHNHFIQSLENAINADITIQYHLWDEYFERIYFRSHDEGGKKENLKKINREEIKDIVTRRKNKTDVFFHSYNIVDSLYKKIKKNTNIDNFPSSESFFIVFSQIIIKAKAAEGKFNDYDLVFLLRTDTIFDPEKYVHLYKRIMKIKTKFEQHNFEKQTTKIRRLHHQRLSLYTTRLKFVNTIGVSIDDSFTFGYGNVIKNFYNNYENKIKTFMENCKVNHYRELTPHYVNAAFGTYYKPEIESYDTKEKPFGHVFDVDWNRELLEYQFQQVHIEEAIELQNIFTIIRPVDAIKNHLKKINTESFHELRSIYKTSQGKKRIEYKMPNNRKQKIHKRFYT